MGWYFQLTGWLPVKLLVLGLLAFSVLFHLFYGAIRAMAMMRTIFAVFGAVSMLFAWLALLDAALPALGLFFAPVVICIFLLGFLPTVWTRPTTTARKIGTTVLLVGVYLAATLLAGAGVIVVEWPT